MSILHSTHSGHEESHLEWLKIILNAIMPTGVYKRTKYHKEIYRNAKLKNPVRYWKGKKRYEETKIKISLNNKGKHHSLKTEFKKGEKAKNWNGFQKGEKSRLWQGGKSFEKYTLDWTNTLRKSIKERDHYICNICLGDGNVVHHIDYNKKNCNPDNLITLCNSCHNKTNYKREYWVDYFKRIKL